MKKTKMTTMPLSNVELDSFNFTLKAAGFSAALTQLMKNNKTLATQINMVSAAFKEQDPNGPSPLDALTEAINNLPNGNSSALVVATFGDKLVARMKGNDDLILKSIAKTIIEQEDIKKVLEVSVIANHMFSSITDSIAHSFGRPMGARSNPLEDLMGARRNPLEDLMDLMDKLEDSPERKQRGPFGGGFGI